MILKVLGLVAQVKNKILHFFVLFSTAPLLLLFLYPASQTNTLMNIMNTLHIFSQVCRLICLIFIGL